MTVATAVGAFVQQKRENGFAYVSLGLQLRSFSLRTGAVELAALTPGHISSFLDLAPSTYTWRRKYAQIAEFILYWHAHGEMPPLQMPARRGPVRQTFRPYVYTRSELRRLFEQIPDLPRNGNSTYEAETVRALLLLLYGTGVRLTDAIVLRPEHVNLENREIRIPARASAPGRTIPIGADTTRVLRRYTRWKARTGVNGERYFARRGGLLLNRDSLYDIFHKLLAGAGVARRDRIPDRPRIFDLRSTFAVHQITGWIRKGRDLNRLLPALAHYMGLRDLNATEQFLSLTPERFRNELGKLSPLEGPKWSHDAAAMQVVTELSK